jgi:hypothetical protein
MEEPDQELEYFDEIVRGCGKEHLQLRVQVVQRAPVWGHVVVSSAFAAAAYQLGHSWPLGFTRDLAAGMFG